MFIALFPNVMPSSTDAAYSLTVVNASSTPYTLKVMTVVALIFTPIVLAYQAWTFWVFRRRLSTGDLPARFRPDAGWSPQPTASHHPSRAPHRDAQRVGDRIMVVVRPVDPRLLRQTSSARVPLR